MNYLEVLINHNKNFNNLLYLYKYILNRMAMPILPTQASLI